MDEPSSFSDVSNRIDEIDRRLERLAVRIETKADGPALVRELDWIRSELGRVRDAEMLEIGKLRAEMTTAVQRTDGATNDVIRSSRSETLKLLLASMSAFAALLGGIVALYGSGKIT